MSVIVAVLVLAAGTYAFRLIGPLLDRPVRQEGAAAENAGAEVGAGRGVRLPPLVDGLLSDAAIVLLAALIATSAVTQGQGFAGWARPIGVGVAAVLALVRAPFPVVVIAAAAVTALLRALGLD